MPKNQSTLSDTLFDVTNSAVNAVPDMVNVLRMVMDTGLANTMESWFTARISREQDARSSLAIGEYYDAYATYISIASSAVLSAWLIRMKIESSYGSLNSSDQN